MTDIPCPACGATGELQSHLGYGTYVPYVCNCCGGKKVVDIEDAHRFITLLMEEVEDQTYEAESLAKELAGEKLVTEQLRRDLGDSKILVEHFRARAGNLA